MHSGICVAILWDNERKTRLIQLVKHGIFVHVPCLKPSWKNLGHTETDFYWCKEKIPRKMAYQSQYQSEWNSRVETPMLYLPSHSSAFLCILHIARCNLNDILLCNIAYFRVTGALFEPFRICPVHFICWFTLKKIYQHCESKFTTNRQMKTLSFLYIFLETAN